MVEFRGVVNFDEKGELVCFCSQQEALKGQCLCQNKYDCPEALITIDILQGTRPSEKGIKKIVRASNVAVKEVNKIKEGLSQLEKAVKNIKFRI